LEKYGGRLLLNTHVDEILLEGGRAVGIRVRPTRGTNKTPYTIRAPKAVISNASTWDTAKLLPKGALPAQSYINRANVTEKTDSFMHLHLGIDATGLPSDLECHHFVLHDWKRGVGAPQNVCLVSIPTVFDPSLAPEGCHVVHAYTAGNEPYSIWKGMDRKSPEYAALKEERSEVLWQTLEKVIPDIRDRVKLKLVGTPLTHERYLRRSEGTYGPAIRAGRDSFPGAASEIPGLLCCGDSTMPGIGVPAVAASGMITANSLVPVWQHWALLDSLDVAAA
jgi:phytoene dehydrogenase-like protein